MAMTEEMENEPLYEFIARVESQLNSHAPQDIDAILREIDAAEKRRGASPWLYGLKALAYRLQSDNISQASARSAAREALALAPDDTELGLRVVPVLMQTGAERDGITALERLTRRNPDEPEIWAQLVEAWLLVEEKEKAERAFKRFSALAPDDNDRILRLSEKINGEGKIGSAYVRALFDGYADRFDSDLVGKLQYVTPQVMAGMLEEALKGAAPKSLAVADLGCGTGLMGPYLAPYAAQLKGVDLSPRMLAVAESRGLYDELAATDLVSFLNDHLRSFNVITAADVLVYIGDLDETFEAVARSLKPGGVFAASVEKTAGEDDYILQPTKRFAHSLDYLKYLCTAHNLQLEQMLEFQPRREGAGFINGYAFVVRKAA